jgi:predicted secreted protein
MSLTWRSGLVCVVAMSAWTAQAQSSALPAPQNMAQLSATASVEAQQDWLSMSLTVARDGADAALVQTQIKAALDAALTEARKLVQPGQLEVRTGNFGLYPRTMVIGQVSFSLSRELRAKTEQEAQGQAIEQFKARAGEISRGFGFAGYSLREVSVQANAQGPMPRQRALAMEISKASSDTPVPVEAGKALVQVTVSGSIQMK